MQAQGQTLDAAGLYMGRDFFSHGQVYVAFSRVGNPGCIKVNTNATEILCAIQFVISKVLKRRGMGEKGRPVKMKNVVFKAVLV